MFATSVFLMIINKYKETCVLESKSVLCDEAKIQHKRPLSEIY